MMEKPKVATVWLEGCSGCHMSFLDLDEDLLGVLNAVELTVSPVTDFKNYDFGRVTLGIVEGAVANSEHLEIVEKLRRSCEVLMAWGDCAVFGGINRLRDNIAVADLLRIGFVETAGTVAGAPPADSKLPALLPRVKAVNEVVRVESYVPGCPPSPEAIAHAILEVLGGRPPILPRRLLQYD
jgi:NAD-reducing hydrogenase small subunit